MPNFDFFKQDKQFNTFSDVAVTTEHILHIVPASASWVHLYRKSGKINSYGIKFFAFEMKPDVDEVRKTKICAEKERTPGATTT